MNPFVRAFFLLLLCAPALPAQTPSPEYNYLQTETFRGAGATQPVTTIEYLDGLGRPLQSVTHRASPSRNDLVSGHVVYDAFGRPAQTYLPAPAPGGTGAYQPDLPTHAGSFYNDARPFSRPVYESSPLSRTLEAYGPGNDWHTANRRPQTEFLLNPAGEVRLWQVQAGGTLTSGGAQPHYAAGTLTKTRLTDEENNQVIEYQDQQGRVVQKNVQDGEGSWMVTSYVYDEMERLAYVIPPKLHAARVPADGAVTLSESTDKELLFAYRYDKKGRVTEKLVPGGDWTYLVYNRTDQPVLTQNARQRGSSQWSFTKYDPHGRVVLAGETALAGKSRSDLQGEADAVAACFETRTGSLHGYTNGAYPQVSPEQVHLVNYYDDYQWGVPAGAEPYGMGFTAFEGLTQQPAHGLLTGSKARLLGGSGEMLLSVSYYDAKGRLVQTHQQNPFKGSSGDFPVSRTDLTLGFSGEVLKSATAYRYADGKAPYSVVSEHLYDHLGRKIRTNHSVNGAAPLTLAEYTYDEVGRLQQKHLQLGSYRTIEGSVPTDQVVRNTSVSGTVSDEAGKITLKAGFAVAGGGSTYTATPKGLQYGTTPALQVVDMHYNLRGWLKSLNGGSLKAEENDLFALQLDYQENGGLYNGNIKKQSWKSYSAKEAGRSYTYSYDQAGRLTDAAYGGGKYPGENYSVSNLTYDKNGNLLSLNRRGMSGGTPASPVFAASNTIDQLTYTYPAGSNKLASVSDAVTGNLDAGDFRDGNTAGQDYAYYSDGSLSSDQNKGITSVVYNSLGLVQTLQMSKVVNGALTSYQIEYLYDGSGRKWQKKAYNATLQQTAYTYYDQGIQYETDQSRINALSYILHPEGRIIQDAQSGQLAYEYHYQDHLGNLRVAFRQQSPVTSSARLSFEPQNAVEEEAAFQSVTTSRAAGVAQEGRYAARLQREAGPQKTVRLQEGETLKAEVFAHFEQQKNRRTTWLPLPVFEQEPQLLDGRNRRKLALRSGFVLPLRYKRRQGQMPEAFLEVVVRDSSGSITFQERKALSLLAGQQWQQLKIEYKAKADETARVSLVNQSSTAAYFDNLTVSQEPPVIVQENHYDPWGLNLAGIEKQGNPDHKFQFNGIEKESDLGLNWDMAKYRTLDPQLGRFHQIDPKIEVFDGVTPYNFALNNPILYNDPEGDIPPVFAYLAGQFVRGAAEEYVTQVATNLVQGKSLGAALTEVDGGQILTAGTTNALTGGFGKAAKFVSGALKVANNVNNGSKAVKAVGVIEHSDEAMKVFKKDLGKAIQKGEVPEGMSKHMDNMGAYPKSKHGNIKGNQPAEQYRLEDQTTGDLQKYGETTRGERAFGPGNQKRYSQEELDQTNSRYVKEVEGTKRDMHNLQHDKIENYKTNNNGKRPPLNKSDW